MPNFLNPKNNIWFDNLDFAIYFLVKFPFHFCHFIFIRISLNSTWIYNDSGFEVLCGEILCFSHAFVGFLQGLHMFFNPTGHTAHLRWKDVCTVCRTSGEKVLLKRVKKTLLIAVLYQQTEDAQSKGGNALLGIRNFWWGLLNIPFGLMFLCFWSCRETQITVCWRKFYPRKVPGDYFPIH